MSTPAPKTVSPKKVRDPRTGLRTSATLATVFTVLGHAFIGFEQSVGHVFVALATGYACALLFETVDARANGRTPAFAGGGTGKVVDFLLSTHMTSITMSFLLYSNSRFLVLVFAVAAAIGSKYIFRVVIDGKSRHFMNPSNFGITLTLILFPWMAAIPWALSTRLHGVGAWLLPAIIVMLGFRLNLLFTQRLPLIAAFLVAFFVQAALRSTIYGNPFLADIAALTNVPVLLFTFYMITDPQTSPSALRKQIAFGAAVALSYGLMLALHYAYHLFYSVTLVTAIRGAGLYLASLRERRQAAASIAPAHGDAQPNDIGAAA